MKDTSNKIFEQLNIKNKELQKWSSIYNYDVLNEDIKLIEKGEPLFVRLDKLEEIEYIKEGMKNG